MESKGAAIGRGVKVQQLSLADQLRLWPLKRGTKWPNTFNMSPFCSAESTYRTVATFTEKRRDSWKLDLASCSSLKAVTEDGRSISNREREKGKE